ncbi:endolytic transglycosylase MltG [Oxalobacteraceae bacterium CAVE-383]|nr:endolytic transglycosylase MltG [Oxalobacteraceae bacterium CAVE-383]
MKKFLLLILIVAAAAGGGLAYWAKQPILAGQQAPLPFAIEAGSSLAGSSEQIAAAGIPLDPTLFSLLARLTGKGSRIKAGSYELKPGASPLRLLNQLVRGEFAQESLTIIEGWSFRQMRAAIAANPGLRHDTAALSDSELMARISSDYALPEGLFFPDTYLFAKGASDLQIYKQAYATMIRKLGEAWELRDPSLPYRTPYEALTMASIVEKETGQKADRSMIAGVFVNRLKQGMPLQTDPSVIYGMGERYHGNLRKIDLQTDTPHNTYTRRGLPPTPISLPGAASLAAALAPEHTDAVYFVARGDGSSQFSNNLSDHNRAVNLYQRLTQR